MSCDYFRPVVENPYPDDDFRAVTDFRYHTRLTLVRNPVAATICLDQRREASYILGEDYPVTFKVDGVERSLAAPKGMLTDLTSVPRIAQPIVGRVGPHLEAAIVHDFLFIAWQLIEGRGPRKRDFRYANAVMYAALRVSSPWLSRAAIRFALEFPRVSWGFYRQPNHFPIGERLFVRLP